MINYTTKNTSQNINTWSTEVSVNRDLSTTIGSWSAMLFNPGDVNYAADTAVFTEDNGTLNLAFGASLANTTARGSAYGDLWTPTRSRSLSFPKTGGVWP